MYYKKVIIKSEADLPKVKTACYFHDKVMGNITLFHCPSSDTVMRHFINECDFFLQPVEEELYPKSFVEWLCEKGTCQQEEQPNIWMNTLNELFEYWQNMKK